MLVIHIAVDFMLWTYFRFYKIYVTLISQLHTVFIFIKKLNHDIEQYVFAQLLLPHNHTFYEPSISTHYCS